MVWGILPRWLAAVLVIGLSTVGHSAGAIEPGPHKRVCATPVLSEALAVVVDIKTADAETVSESQRFHHVEPLLTLYLQYDPRTHLARRLFNRLVRARFADLVAEEVGVRSRKLILEESEVTPFSPFQLDVLGESLADVLRWRDRREAALQSSNAFLFHFDRALLKRLEKLTRDTLRSENKRRRALHEQWHYRELLDEHRVRMVTKEEESLIQVPFLAKLSDFNDEFERVVLDRLFKNGSNAEWALCTAGDSLRIVLAHGDKEPSADVLAFHRNSRSLYIIEIKRSPTGFAHAVEQLEETRAHLRRIGVQLPIHTAIASPKHMEIHSPFREGRHGDLLRDDHPVYVGNERVQIFRF